MRFTVFGLSMTSSWGNGHATVYRGLLKELSRRGAEITFVEKDVPWYASNRDLTAADFARIILYRDRELEDILEAELATTDVVLLGSYFPDGAALADRLSGRSELIRLYYDIDTPVTLRAFSERGGTFYLRADQIALFDAVLSFTGGPTIRDLVERWGARRALALYCALDPECHLPVAKDDRFRCRLGYMGTYSEDRHKAWEALFLGPAMRLTQHRFILAGPQYPEADLPANVTHFHHLPPSDHSAFYSSCDITLNLTRAPMVAIGYSPSVRLFEAAGCSACVISDQWPGLGELFEVGKEILVARGEAEMVDLLERLGQEETMAIGQRLRDRVLREHTYAARADQLLDLLRSL